MKTLRLTLAVTLSIFLTAAARAEMKWEQTSIELHPTVNDKTAVAHFKYQNVGKTPVHIKSVHASCGCTTAQTQKDQVGPGEKGEITATFNIGDRTGIQTKTVTVETDDTVQTMTMLTLKAVIPNTLEVAPAFVFWQDGEKADPKTITVKADKDFPVKEIKVTSSSTDFQTKVEKTGNGQFKIDVQPRDVSRLLAGTLTIQPDNSSKVFNVNMRVMGPPPAPVSNPVANPPVKPAPNPAASPSSSPPVY